MQGIGDARHPDDPSPEARLIEFATTVRWSGIPRAVQRAVSTLVADAIANAVAGRLSADTPRFDAVGGILYGGGRSTVIAGTPRSMVDAVGRNAFQITSNTMCDVYRPGLCHVTPEVVPAALAAAEYADRSGPDLLLAVAVGMEITTRVCQAINYPAFRARGWHSPGVAGALGASVAAGLLLGLDPEALAGSLGLAGSQAAGTFAAAGTVGVKFHQMNGARAGIVAAVHAAHGLPGPQQVLTAADGGLLRAFSDGADPELLTVELGDRWELLNIATRAYPAASTLQSLVSCLVDESGACDIREIEEVIVELPAEAYRLGAYAGWESELRAMQSARFVTAAVLHTGSCWVDLYHVRNRSDPRITDFARDRVVIQENTGLADGAVHIRIATPTGTRSSDRAIAPGDPRLPLSAEQLAAKIDRCLYGADVPLAHRAENHRLQHLDAEPTVRALLADLAAGPDSGRS